jgi:glycosyltransferase involved in cell wall biosynthesis
MEDRIPERPPVIPPVAEGIHRPMWSVMIPAYNCIGHLEATIRCVLAQDPGEEHMQIEVVDDRSTDGDVQALVERVGRGRVGYHRQPRNRGSLRNFETCLKRSTGHYVHLLHGDDMVKKGFYEEIASLFKEDPAIGAAFTKYTYTDEDGTETPPGAESISTERGIVKDWLYKIAERQKLQPPAIVVRRSVYEELGGYFAVHYGEDWEMYMRIASRHPVAYSPRCLALYRRYNNKGNITSNALRTGQNVRDVETVIRIAKDYLPPGKRYILDRIARKNYAVQFGRDAIHLLDRNKEVAFVQGWSAFKFHPHPKTIYLLAMLYWKHATSIVSGRKKMTEVFG